MRIPTRLSYSSFARWESNPEEFYLKNASSNRPEREPQEKPASIGSGFDARVKSALYLALFGANDPKYTFEALFEAQVETHNRDYVLPESQYLFDEYVKLGVYNDLLRQLLNSTTDPRFEFDVNASIEGIPILAKPDCQWTMPGNIHITSDWKVNGYCSKSSTSPTKGYMFARPDNKPHKDFKAETFEGVPISQAYLEDCSQSWADQLSLYDWALGGKIGSERLLQIHQLVFKIIPDKRPLVRVAEYRTRVRDSYQHYLAKRLHKCWDSVSIGHIFPDLSLEESNAKCQLLEDQAKFVFNDGTAESEFLMETSRRKFRG